VAHGDKIVMEPTLELALQQIFGGQVPEDDIGKEDDVTQESPVGEAPLTELNDLIQRANDLYSQAQTRLQAGDWTGYGESLNRLKDTLDDMADKVE